MTNKRITKIAKVLVDYSTKVQEGERVVITAPPVAQPLVLEVYKMCLQRGAHPVIRTPLPGAAYVFYKYAKDNQLMRFPKTAMFEMKNTDAYIAIRAPLNTNEFASVDPTKIAMRSKILSPISKWRLQKTKWVAFDYPTTAYAQNASMSLHDYQDFAFNAINLNWTKLRTRLQKIADAVNSSEKVHVIGPGTDLKFTVKSTRAVLGDGTNNMPGGEVFTAPDKYSVNGHITFNYPAIYRSNEVRGVQLKLKKGKVIEEDATSGLDFLKAMLNLDSGSRYVGEWGIGCNYNIKQFTKNTLFDEKIGGTVHFALGHGYKECNARIRSALHWDLVKDLRRNGTIYLDGKLFQKNGRFRKV
ncbi:aminopeptidase [Candidatus Woesearchaeota archaeon]|nr:aminopeptidase [Candidatus Woesearchaeota archaeon]MBW3006025.1 aminopeptidase [Candidatus Woesearchaeota archaeon]